MRSRRDPFAGEKADSGPDAMRPTTSGTCSRCQRSDRPRGSNLWRSRPPPRFCGRQNPENTRVVAPKTLTPRSMRRLAMRDFQSVARSSREVPGRRPLEARSNATRSCVFASQPSSARLQSIPLEISPRYRRRRILPCGSRDPGGATGTRLSGPTIGRPPKTIWASCPLPRSTSASQIRSAFGCGRTVTTLPTTTPWVPTRSVGYSSEVAAGMSTCQPTRNSVKRPRG
jgi:hypothetical protein